MRIINFLLIYLTSCTEKNQNYRSSNEANKINSTTQHISFNETVNSIDKNIRSIFQAKNGNYWFGTNGAGVYRDVKKTLTPFTVKDGLADKQEISI